jgi:3-oxoadipate enol-lactonase
LTPIEVDCRGAIAVVDDVGEGPPIIVVGAGSPRSLAGRAADGLVARGFRVVNFDYGPPEAWTGDPVLRTSIDQVRDVLDVMDTIGIEQAHAIGISRGGITAYALAARHPDRVDHLVLTVPVAPFADMLGPKPAIDAEVGAAPALDAIVAAVFGADLDGADRALAISIVTAPDGTVARVERHEEEPIGGEEIVRRPTLIVEAGRDVVVSSDHQARLREALPDARSVRFPAATHGSIALDADGFVALVSEFLLDRPLTETSEWHAMPAGRTD